MTYYIRREKDHVVTFHTESRSAAHKVAKSMSEDGLHAYTVLDHDYKVDVVEDADYSTPKATEAANDTTTVKLAYRAREDILKLIEEAHVALSAMSTADPVVFGNKVLDVLRALDEATMTAMRPMAMALAKEHPKAAHAAAAIAALQMLGLLGPSRR